MSHRNLRIENDRNYMSRESPSEAKAKCMVAEILLTEETISTDMVINVLNAIGGIYIAGSEDKE